MADLVYYELGWAILSTICLANVLFGLSVVGIIGLSPVSSIPIIVSSAGAVANGLSYYVFYADYPVTNTAVASVFGDILWMVSLLNTDPFSVVGRRVLIYRPFRSRKRETSSTATPSSPE